MLPAFRSEMLLALGDLRQADVDARTGQQIHLEFGWPTARAFVSASLVEALIDFGRLQEAAREVERAPVAGPADSFPIDYFYNRLWLSRGRLRLAQGRPADALTDLLACGHRQLAMGEPTPALSPWRSLAADALAALGRPDEAAGLVAEELRLARAFGAPRTLTVALLAAARHLGATDRLRLLEEAVDAISASPARLVTAKAQADLGSAVRRAGHRSPARLQLERALDGAHRCGAAPLEDWVLSELHAAGARPRRRATTGIEACTPTERRVAELAAAGLSNREIAQSLFVTVRTVEFHLSSVYRKAGIASRADLPTLLRHASQAAED